MVGPIRVSACALLVALTLAIPAAAQQTRVSGRVVQQDSLVELRQQLERTLGLQRALMQQIERNNTALRRAATDAERETARGRLAELFAKMEGAVAQMEMVRSNLQSACASLPGPDGWLGISFKAELEAKGSPSATKYEFTKYPTIISVEPASPAQKAGLAAGDEIVSLDNRDMVSGALDIAVLLKPGAQLPVRYRRDGKLRDITVLIEPRPRGFLSNCPWIDVVIGPPALAMEPKRRLLRPEPNGFGYVIGDSGVAVVRGRVNRAPVVPRPREAPTPVLPPTPYTALKFQGVVPGANAQIGGASVIPLNAELREGLGVSEGFLVIQVLSGSPALEAGLRVGDIIVSANDRKPTTVMELIRALDESQDGAWVLTVTRNKAKPRIVKLRPR